MIGGRNRKVPSVMQKSTVSGSQGTGVGLGGMGVSVGGIVGIGVGKEVGISVERTSNTGTVEVI